MTGKALGGWRGWWGDGSFWQQWLLNWFCCFLLLCARSTAEPRVSALQRGRGSGQSPPSPATGNAQLNQSSSQEKDKSIPLSSEWARPAWLGYCHQLGSRKETRGRGRRGPSLWQWLSSGEATPSASPVSLITPWIYTLGSAV